MAFNPSSAAANTFPNKGERAKGFINFAFPDKNGVYAKVGAIPLKESVELENWLCEVLAATPENLPKVMAKMKITYNSGERKATAGFTLE